MLKPLWVMEFEDWVKKLKIKSGKIDIYKGEQPSLKKLLQTGMGNCVATSKLFRKILKKHRISYVHVAFGEFDPKKDRHQVTLVYTDCRSIWFQSNTLLKEFQSFSSLIQYAEKEMAWQTKGMTIEEFKKVIFSKK